jgi:hypothetical protein
MLDAQNATRQCISTEAVITGGFSSTMLVGLGRSMGALLAKILGTTKYCQQREEYTGFISEIKPGTHLRLGL